MSSKNVKSVEEKLDLPMMAQSEDCKSGSVPPPPTEGSKEKAPTEEVDAKEGNVQCHKSDSDKSGSDGDSKSGSDSGSKSGSKSGSDSGSKSGSGDSGSDSKSTSGAPSKSKVKGVSRSLKARKKGLNMTLAAGLDPQEQDAQENKVGSEKKSKKKSSKKKNANRDLLGKLQCHKSDSGSDSPDSGSDSKSGSGSGSGSDKDKSTTKDVNKMDITGKKECEVKKQPEVVNTVAASKLEKIVKTDNAPEDGTKKPEAGALEVKEKKSIFGKIMERLPSLGRE